MFFGVVTTLLERGNGAGEPALALGALVGLVMFAANAIALSIANSARATRHATPRPHAARASRAPRP